MVYLQNIEIETTLIAFDCNLDECRCLDAIIFNATELRRIMLSIIRAYSREKHYARDPNELARPSKLVIV